jgi:hypothetical protein
MTEGGRRKVRRLIRERGLTRQCDGWPNPSRAARPLRSGFTLTISDIVIVAAGLMSVSATVNSLIGGPLASNCLQLPSRTITPGNTSLKKPQRALILAMMFETAR